MNFSIKTIAAIFAFAILTISCTKEMKIADPECELEIAIEPLCAFNPKINQETKFPVRVLHNGNSLTHPEFIFSWDVDPNFGGSAISVAYVDLPLKVMITEVATDCTGEAILDKDFWD